MRMVQRIVLMLVVGFVAVACGDSTEDADMTHEGQDQADDQSSGTDATEGQGTDQGTDDSATGTGTDTGSDTGTDDPTTGGTGACTGDSDLGFLETEQRDDGSMGTDVAVDAARDCGLSCLSSADARECTIDCMIDEKGVGVTRDCAGCYGDTVTCTVQNCLAVCVLDSASQECIDCQVESGCVASFYSCTGLEQPEADQAACGQ